MASACPFLGSLGSRALSASAEGPNSNGSAGGTASKCPFGFGGAASKDGGTVQHAGTREAGAQAAAGTGPEQGPGEQQQQPAQCPYGFSSGQTGPKLSKLHCILCKSFLHGTVSCVPCGHKYCRGCIQRWRDCPACGCDVEGLQPDAEAQGLVDLFLRAHTSEGAIPAVTAASTGTGTAASPQEPAAAAATTSPPSSSPPSAEHPTAEQAAPPRRTSAGGQPSNSPAAAAQFFMQLGLSALAGGNPWSALARLEMSKAELLKELGQGAGQDSGGEAASQADPGAGDEAVVQGLVEPCGPIRVAPPSQEPGPGLAVQLGAVFGCQADCCRQLGELGAARALLSASAACLRPAAEGKAGTKNSSSSGTGTAQGSGDAAGSGAEDASSRAEALAALCVTTNKMGDVAYVAQDLPAARAAYEEALRLRRGAAAAAQAALSSAPAGAGRTEHGQAAQGQQQEYTQLLLGVCTSLIKVADAASAMGDNEAAEARLIEAEAIVKQVRSGGSGGSASTEAAGSGPAGAAAKASGCPFHAGKAGTEVQEKKAVQAENQEQEQARLEPEVEAKCAQLERAMQALRAAMQP